VLDTPADVAAAADMMIATLDGPGIVGLVEVMAGSTPPAAARLADELCVRLDLAEDIRDRIAQVIDVPTAPARATPPRRAPRPTAVVMLVDAAARLVMIATRKNTGERRWRRWALLLDADGHIEDSLYEERADADAAPLVDQLIADGYRVASDDSDKARQIVVAAAQIAGEHLDTSYYLARDLLDLGDAHMGGRSHPASNALGRAIELLADGEPVRARLLLARCEAVTPAADQASGVTAEIAAAVAACHLAEGRTAEALPHLERAAADEPTWPLHHWNLAAAHRRLGNLRACHAALQRFVATSALPSGLAADPDQPARLALAERLARELERSARLAGTPITKRR
jgi:hypothetical protein